MRVELLKKELNITNNRYNGAIFFVIANLISICLIYKTNKMNLLLNKEQIMLYVFFVSFYGAGVNKFRILNKIDRGIYEYYIAMGISSSNIIIYEILFEIIHGYKAYILDIVSIFILISVIGSDINLFILLLFSILIFLFSRVANVLFLLKFGKNASIIFFITVLYLLIRINNYKLSSSDVLFILIIFIIFTSIIKSLDNIDFLQNK